MGRLGYARITVVLLSLAVLFAALIPVAHGLAVAVLAPFWFFLWTILRFHIRTAEEPSRSLPFPVLAVFSPRPPPVR
jgi:hypothetical protein